jgi:predicted RNase H-like HicB family nuclease
MTEQVTLDKPVTLNVELQEESETGRWIADVTDIPGVMAYGATAFEALAKAKVLAIEVVGDRLAHGEDPLTGCELGEACPPYGAAAGFAGIEFHHHALAS